MSDFVDYHWLISREGSSWIAEGMAANLPLLRLIDKLRKSLPASRAQLVAEQVFLREKAVEKFGVLATQMYFTDRALQQATDLAVASHKASRFPPGTEVFDYCCGIGGDLLALANRGPTVGVDQDPVMALLAKANLQACQRNKLASVQTSLAEDFPPGTDTLWHLDPDRRVAGRRSTRPQWHSPSETTITNWLEIAPHGAIKFAPAAELSADWQRRSELEWISHKRSCRQQVAWFGDLAQSPGRRRATGVDRPAEDASIGTFLGDPQTRVPVAEEISNFVFDTDPAIRAAHLTGAFGAHLGCEAISVGEAYLTSNSPANHPLAVCYLVQDVLPLRLPKLVKHLRSLNIGYLEIKTREVSLSPENLRKRLKLNGSKKATLLVTRQGQQEIAILGERYESPGVTNLDNCD